MTNGRLVEFHVRLKHVNTPSVTSLAYVSLEIPYRFPLGGRVLTREDKEEYIKDTFGLEVVHWVEE